MAVTHQNVSLRIRWSQSPSLTKQTAYGSFIGVARHGFVTTKPSCKGNTFPLDPLEKMDAKMNPSKKRGAKTRDEILRFRLSKDEKALVKSLARQYGFRTVSTYIRSLINPDKVPSVMDRRLLIQLNAELGKEGSNLNQIAKAINIRMLHGEEININPDLLHGTVTNITNLTKQLLEILKDVRIRENQK